ncbi:Mov34/MPN/PAD-1 family protein [Chitinophaga tropicalis]|uniref:Thiamine biosynthesis protein ThiF n=1 Tax=Chitinophaga tropicalis TaxID=2683588 RepID=A0A7K1U6R7_9BACT|nr:Mov34/MPN/PAD-1 family protein [Chitinophaga tropicalis]MVT10052.1 thiamine biosynthesis protein ThiF [Chitinophaga tropicalis]
MEQVLYSECLQPFEGQLTNPALRETIDQMKAFVAVPTLTLLNWSDSEIAVPLVLEVALPPLGNVDGVDIREKEPVVVVFSTSGYPRIAPKVFTDRLDFPDSVSPHMFLRNDGRPPGFCLVRGGLSAANEWYSNKRISDVLIRVSNWLRDAACGELALNGDSFDPLRLTSYEGTVTYDYDQLAKIVRQSSSLYLNGNFARLQFELKNTKDSFNRTLIQVVPLDKLEAEQAHEAEEGRKSKDDPTRKVLCRGLLIWSESDTPIDRYNVELPKDWDTFKNEFCGQHLIDAEALEQELCRPQSGFYVYVPIIVAIKRPKTVFGFSDAIEFINFELEQKEDPDYPDRMDPGAPLSYSSHVQPLTPAKAAAISGFNYMQEKETLIAGAGALGSKIALHLIKCGARLLIADDDWLLPHNLVRHGLNAAYTFHYKAKAMAREAIRLFPNETVRVTPFAAKADILLQKDLGEVCSRILDFTASGSFQNELIKADIGEGIEVARGYLSDTGQLGILLVEGAGRNPRIDDLQAQLYHHAIQDTQVSAWLRRESELNSKTDLVTVGVGCHSDTTVLSDDIISVHAGIMSGLVKSASQAPPSKEGMVYLNQVSQEPFFQSATARHTFLPVDVMASQNPSDWEIRFSSGIVDLLKAQMRQASPNETGGVLIGCANFKTKTIHVTGLVDAPPDSKADRCCFFRGKEGLAQTVQHITEATGGQIGYIGEWHSHPKGPDAMSGTDTETVTRFKKTYQQEVTPLPVFLLIVTPRAVLPFVF